MFLWIGDGAANVALLQAILQKRHAQAGKSQLFLAQFSACNVPHAKFSCGVAIGIFWNSVFYAFLRQSFLCNFMMQSLQHGQFFVASCVRFVDSSATPRSRSCIAIYDFESKLEHLESHRGTGKGTARCRQEDVFEGARSQSWLTNNRFPENKKKNSTKKQN